VDLPTAVTVAQADAWAAEGRLREASGGGSADLPGIRVMSSGLPFRQWNSADLGQAGADLDPARAWYAAKGVPWGIRMPAGLSPLPGKPLLHRRYMGLRPDTFVPAPQPPDRTVDIRPAGPADVEMVAEVDAAAFGDDLAPALQWLAPQLADPGWQVYVAYVDGRPVGVATSSRTDDRAGPAVAVSGVGVLEAHRRQGIGAALSSRAVVDGLAAGARLAHLSPDTDAAASIYARLGFVEVPGVDIYVDV